MRTIARINGQQLDHHHGGLRLVVRIAGLAVVCTSSLVGCALPADAMCSDGQHPVYAVENSTGAQCVKDGRPSPPGMADYPPKRVPEHVGDRYDRWPLAEDYPWRDEVDPQLLARYGES